MKNNKSDLSSFEQTASGLDGESPDSKRMRGCPGDEKPGNPLGHRNGVGFNGDKPPQTPDQNQAGVEDFIGKRVLPAVGAILLLSALGYSAPVTYQRLSAAGAFSLELVFCGIFFAIGRLMREAKFHFGEVLSGIGAGGLLVTIAGGGQFQHLYSGQTMVGLCLAVSLAIGAYGVILESRTFQCIGAIGGMISSWMPCAQHELYASAAMQAVIVSATLAVFVHSKWRAGILLLWPVALIASIQFVFGSGLDWRWQVAAIDLIGLEFAFAYALVHEESRFDPGMVFSAVGLATSMILSICVKSEMAGSLHEGIFCGLIAATGLTFTAQREKREIFLFCAGAGAITVMPFGLKSGPNVLAWATLSCLASLMAFRRRSLQISYIALLESFVALCAYFAADGVFPAISSLGAVVLLFALAACPLAFYRSSRFGGVVTVGCGILGWILITELTSKGGIPFGTDAATSGLWALWALVLLGLGYATKHRAGRVCGYLLLGLTLIKVLTNDLGTLSNSQKAAALLALGLAMLFGGFIAIRSKSGESSNS